MALVVGDGGGASEPRIKIAGDNPVKIPDFSAPGTPSDITPDGWTGPPPGPPPPPPGLVTGSVPAGPPPMTGPPSGITIPPPADSETETEFMTRCTSAVQAQGVSAPEATQWCKQAWDSSTSVLDVSISKSKTKKRK